MTMRMSIAALLAALICTGPAAAQAPVSSLQFINTSTEAVDVLFDSHAVLTDFEARGTTGHYHTLYVTHTVAAVTGADTVTVSQRFRTGAHCHVFVAPGGGLLVKEDVRIARPPTGVSECYILNVSGSPILVRLLDALNNNAFADTLAAQLTGGATSGYQRFPHSEYNFEVSAPGGSMAPETFYLNTMTGFNLAERPFVLVVARTAGGTGLRMSTLSGAHQLAYEDLAVSTSTEAEEMPQAFTLHGNYPNPFNPATTVAFTLATSASVHMVVSDLLGREVLVVPSQELAAGEQTISVDAGHLPSGIYVYRLGASSGAAKSVQHGRMTLLK